MSEIKAFIFDLDGVIVDTAKYHYQAWRALAQRLGFDYSEKDNELLKGVSRVRSLEILLELGKYKATESEKETFAFQKNEQYVELISKMGSEEILPGALDFLTNAKQAGLKIALGSASKNAPLILRKIGIEDLFDAIVDGNSVQKAKPDPEVFLKGAEALGVLAETCVVFEDAAAGIKAAINANMKTVGIGSVEVLGDADVIYSGFNGITVDEILNQLV